jgi:RNA-directed DNA polymerase
MSNQIAWKHINWTFVQKRVNRYQRRIFKASQSCNKRKVRFVQKLIVNSLDAKLLAVRKVTTDNKGTKTPGVDEKLYLTSNEKIQLVKSLRIDAKASPICRVFIPKPGRTEKRPLGIPTILDRAKQTLMLLALEPEWEAKFEPNSYGFRPGRSCHDAVEAIFNALHSTKSEYAYKYVLDAALKGCFDNINHQYLLNKIDTLPEFTAQIKAWLEAGIFESYIKSSHYDLGPNNQIGTPQGGTISPFLANVALHGMEHILKQWILTKPHFYKKKTTLAKQQAITVIRYADDFIIMHVNQQVVIEAKEILTEWFANTSGLEFNQEKTSIRQSNKGFQFLGHSFINIQRHGKQRVKIYPSIKSQKKLLIKVRDIIQHNKATSTYELIKKLRPVTQGWANFFKYSECSKVFNRIDNLIFNKLRAWVFRRDRRNGRIFIKTKYFPEPGTYTYNDVQHVNKWILNGTAMTTAGKKETTFLAPLSWTKSEKFIKIQGTASPYDGNDSYWMKRSVKFGNLTPSKQKILLRQACLCNVS